MGAISEFVGRKQGPKLSSPQREGAATWSQIFGRTSKEDTERFPRVRPDTTGGSVLSTNNATKRLLQALRSMAPGGWTDDRWEESKHLLGMVYTAIHRTGEILSMADFQVMRKDPRVPDGMRPVQEGEEAYELVQILERPNNEDTFGDLLYCFPAGTRVRMADGTNKPIEDVHLLDEVVSAEGNVRKVCQCHARDYTGDLIQLRLWGHTFLRMTPNHKVLTKRGYVAAEDLTADDWVAIPRYSPVACAILQTASHIEGERAETKAWYPEKEYGRSSSVKFATEGSPWANFNRVPDFLELTPGFGKILGFYLAEGFASGYTVAWSFGKDEEHTLAAECARLLRDELGLEPNVRVQGSVTLVTVCGKLWVRLFRSLCGSGAGTKRIHPDLLGGSPEFLKEMMNGWIAGDGYTQGGKPCGTSTSHDLALGMFDVANRLGLRPSILVDKAPSGSGRKIGEHTVRSKLSCYRVYLKSTSDNSRVQLTDSVMWRRVRRLDREAFSGKVFNIGVEGDNSYIAEGIGTHNCWNMQMDLTGTALTWMVPNVFGRPFELYPIPTATAIPQPVLDPTYPQGFYRIQPLYPYGPFSSYPTPSSAVGAPIDARWVMRFKYPHPLLRYDGYSPLTAMRSYVDQLESIDRSRWYSMRRTVNPSATLNFDEIEGMEPLDDVAIDRLIADFESAHQSPENAGRLFVCPPGGKLEPWGTAPKDMDYHQGWEQIASFVLGGGFGITKEAAGMIQQSSYSNLFAALKQLYWLTLEPKVNRIAEKLTRFLAPFFGPNLIVQIRCKRIDDHEVRNSRIQQLTSAKAITKNEVRREMDMPLTTEPWGDEIAGEPPGGGQQDMMGGMGGEDVGGEEGMGEEGVGEDLFLDEDEEGGLGGEDLFLDEDEEAEQSRPRPGPLGEGSLGPRLKRLTSRIQHILVGGSTNGHHHRNGR